MTHPDSADGGFFDLPDRPTHPDMATISDLLLSGDAAAFDGTFTAWKEQALGPTAGIVDDLSMVDALTILDEYRDQPTPTAPTGPLTTGWMAGFRAGIDYRLHTPTTDTTDSPRTSAGLFGPVDPASVTWAARQRANRVQDAFPEHLSDSFLLTLMLRRLWVEGFMIGYMFPVRDAELHPGRN